MKGIIFFLTLPVLVFLSIEDIKHKRIPPAATGYIFIIGVLRQILLGENPGRFFLEFLLGSVLVLGLFYIFKGKKLGAGDVKLMGAGAWLLGVGQMLEATLLGCIFALIKNRRERDKTFALGPYLALGIVVNLVRWMMK